MLQLIPIQHMPLLNAAAAVCVTPQLGNAVALMDSPVMLVRELFVRMNALDMGDV
jgi:hypothetical protein